VVRHPALAPLAHPTPALAQRRTFMNGSVVALTPRADRARFIRDIMMTTGFSAEGQAITTVLANLRRGFWQYAGRTQPMFRTSAIFGGGRGPFHNARRGKVLKEHSTREYYGLAIAQDEWQSSRPFTLKTTACA
jgi:hypothetical protein